MSVARGFGLNGKSFYTNVVTPKYVNLSFTVTPTNGLGVTSVKSNGYINNVFMHTSTTPTANNGITNPNPANGFCLVQFKNNFNYYLNGFVQAQAPNTGSIKIDNSALTAGQVYVITTLGDATLAKWQAIGVPYGITPAVGVTFTALGTGGTGNALTSRVSTPSTSGIFGAEIVGNPQTMLANSNIASNAGAWVALQFMGAALTMTAYTPAGTNSAPVFTGSALGSHTHDMLYKNAAVADGATTRVNAGANLLGANTGSDITVVGAGANGGIVNASAGTPAGEVAAPTFTGTEATLTGTVALGVTAPTTGTVISMCFAWDGSSVTIDGL